MNERPPSTAATSSATAALAPPTIAGALDPQRSSAPPSRPPTATHQDVFSFNSQASQPQPPAASSQPATAGADPNSLATVAGVATATTTLQTTNAHAELQTAAVAAVVTSQAQSSQSELAQSLSAASFSLLTRFGCAASLVAAALTAQPGADTARAFETQSTASMSAWVQSIGWIPPEGYADVGTPPTFAWTGDMSSPALSEGAEWDFGRGDRGGRPRRENVRRDSQS